MERFLKYGLCSDELKHVSEVKNGLACNCVCSNCKHPLVAKNNPTNKKVAHFAHQSGKECDGAIETALHLLAKSILLKTKRLTLPDYHFDYDQTNDETIFKESRELAFEEIILEKQVEVAGEKIIPDAIGVIQGKQIFIEFANTHFVDQDKKQKIKTLGVACIEVDLREQLLDESLLTSFLNTNTPSKYWIANPRLDKEYLEHKRKLSEQKKLKSQLKAIEEENKRKEDAAKFNRYKNDKSVKLLLLRDGEITNCPKKKVALSQLTTSHFYRHPVLKKIIDGEFWNGEIYGYMPNGKWIFVRQEKVIVFPPDNKYENLSEQEIKTNKLFFAGLQELKSTLDNPTFGDCGKCKFSVDYFSIDDKCYEVCKHPNE